MNKLPQIMFTGICAWLLTGFCTSLQAEDQKIETSTPSAVVAVSTAQVSETQPAKPRYSGVCTENLQNLCPDAKTRREATECLMAHKDQLSEKCRIAAETISAQITSYDAACKDDAAKFCADAKGHQALGQCLKQNENNLSDSCKTARTSWMEKPKSASTDTAVPQQPAAPAVSSATAQPEAGK